MKKTSLAVALWLTFSNSGVYAASNPSPAPSKENKKAWALTPEQRQNMAKLHEQMAACLRTDKPMKECHDEMKKNCEAMGKEGCPMMGWPHGKMHHHGMPKEGGGAEQ